MTDREVLAALDRLEPLLTGPLEACDAQSVAAWHEAFRAAVAEAERGPGWAEVQARGKVLGNLLNRRMAMLQAAQQGLKAELGKMATGRRALSAYQSK
jgi:uncharacterized small protein (DUF1192 family)